MSQSSPPPSQASSPAPSTNGHSQMSPHMSTQNGPSDAFMPPAKRQRLSPNNASSPSPYQPPPPPNSSFQSMYTNPNYSGQNSFRYPQLPQNAFALRTPQPMSNGYPSPAASSPQSMTGVMGPPQRPAERPAQQSQQDKPPAEEKDISFEAMNDVAAASGVDLSKEEDLLRIRGRYVPSYASQQSRDSGTQGSQDASSGSFSFGERGALQQVSQKSQEEELWDKHKAAARRFNETQQDYLNNPFLLGAVMRNKLQAIAETQKVGVPVDGLSHLQPAPGMMNGQRMQHASDGSSIIAAQSLSAPSKLAKGSTLDPILSLLSIATSERLRGVIEDAYGAARSRQMSSDGTVPPDWASIAINTDGVPPEKATITPVSVTQTSWDEPKFPSTGSQETLAFRPAAHPITQALTSLSKQDRAAEEARLKKRASRKSRRADEAAASAAKDIAAGTPDRAGTPGAGEPRLTKKEQAKLSKQDMNEEASTKAANVTAQMQIGGKQYSWMSGGKKNAAGLKRPAPVPSASASGTISGTATPKAAQEGAASGKDRKFGVWREDGVGGKGVQLRDLVGVLETDGTARKTLQLALNKLGRDEVKET